MSITVAQQAEPIPGYRLLERLGSGGFGEVWKAEAPGGILKAIKFVFGNHSEADQDRQFIQQELKALHRVKSVRHPYILSLERFDIVDGRLMIVMELAERNLWQRFQECRAQGLPGIPRDELLDYMDEIAEALDLMNIQYQLQHLDIKPQNLFLVHNHVKVGDFGLVKDLDGIRTVVTSGVTPVYAAPETFEGVISRFCDQYNLAIVYQELLTGQRPFTGAHYAQLLYQHLKDPPNLDSLPFSDREAIGRSLSKKPEERFPTCSDLVKALRRGNRKDPSTVETVSAPRPRGSLTTVDFAVPASPTQLQIQITRPEVTGDGVLRPALVIGLGKMGLEVLHDFRKAIHDKFGSRRALPHVRLLHLDTDPDTVRSASRGDPNAVLAEEESMLARLHRATHYLKPSEGRQPLDAWLDTGLLNRMPRNQAITVGLRALGRLAFVDNYRGILSRLRFELTACVDPKVMAEAERLTQLGLRSNQPRIYIVTSLAGGTGSGMFIDVAYTVRMLLREFGFPHSDVVGLFLVPEVGANTKPDGAQINTLAALTELNHFASPGATFSAFYHENEEILTDREPPFTRFQILAAPSEPSLAGLVTEQAARFGDYLCRDLTTPLGRLADNSRAALPDPPQSAGMKCQCFGSYAILPPRRSLVQRVARRLSCRLVQSWIARERKDLQSDVHAWLERQQEKRGFRLQDVPARLQEACERALGQSPEAAFDAVIASLAGPEAKFADVDPASAMMVLAHLKQLVEGPTDAAHPVALAGILAQAVPAVLAEGQRLLGRMAVALVEEPTFRLAGAEAAIQQLSDILRRLLIELETHVKACDDQAVAAHTQLRSLLDQLRKNSWWQRWSKAKAGAEFVELLRHFAQARFQALVLPRVREIYRKLLDDLNQPLSEIGFCRTQLTELARVPQETVPDKQSALEPGLGRQLLPVGCRTTDEAFHLLDRRIAEKELAELDRDVQAVVRRKFTSLLNICLSPGDLFEGLRLTLQHEMEEYVRRQFGGDNAASIYFEQEAQDEAVLADIAAAFEEAIPELNQPRGAEQKELRILAVPPGASGQRFLKMARQALPEADLLEAADPHDIVFYRELPSVKLADLPQVGAQLREVYRQTTRAGLRTAHTRIDLPWQPPAAES